jgi:signal transduction histidine kinase
MSCREEITRLGKLVADLEQLARVESDALNLVLMVIGAVSLALAAVAGWVLARRISRPVAEAAFMARRISEGDYSYRIENTAGTRELDDLVSAVNHLAGDLAGQEALRKRLTGDVAHELRTPITTVGSHLEAMLEGVWEPTRDRLMSCREDITRLGKLVADLEQLARVESDALNLSKSTVDLLELAHGVAGGFESELLAKEQTLTVGGRPALVAADRERIVQVMTNLLSNAVKYTPEHGHIHVGVEDFPDEGVFYVEDNGIGIPENELQLVFMRFYRTDVSRSRETGGAGIGLSIVKSIVEAHSGTVRAENNDGRGTRFTVTLPKRG